MTDKELRDEQAKIDAFVMQQAKKHGLVTKDIEPIFDGIADENAYLSSKMKVAWILKEPYDDKDKDGNPCGGGWSLVKDCFINHDENWVTIDGRKLWKNPVWQKIAYIMYGFRHGLKWEEMDWIHDHPSMMDEIKSIAWINLSKMPAGTNSSSGWFRYYYDRIWKDVVQKQIDVYNPDVLIFANTFHCFCLPNKAELKKVDRSSNDWVGHYRMGNKWILDTYHPGRKGGDYVNAVIGALNACC